MTARTRSREGSMLSKTLLLRNSRNFYIQATVQQLLKFHVYSYFSKYMYIKKGRFTTGKDCLTCNTNSNKLMMGSHMILDLTQASLLKSNSQPAAGCRRDPRRQCKWNGLNKHILPLAALGPEDVHQKI